MSRQLRAIVASDAEALFVPQYGYEMKDIVQQARAAGWNKSILGGAAWASKDMAECGAVCKGLFFSSHFGAIGVEGAAKKFVDEYKNQNNEIPTGYAALAYDSLNMVLKAIQEMENISSNLMENRIKIKDNLANIKQYHGVTGELAMNASGDPVKSAVVLEIAGNGDFISYKNAQP